MTRARFSTTVAGSGGDTMPTRDQKTCGTINSASSVGWTRNAKSKSRATLQKKEENEEKEKKEEEEEEEEEEERE